jgi:hypothetical protein
MDKKINEAATLKAKARGMLRDAGAMLKDKKLPKAVSDALGNVRTALTSTWADLAAQESAKPLQESGNVGVWFEARLHQSFTYMADDMFADGRLTREERILLSGAIGDALAAFTASLQANAPQLYDRAIWEEPPETVTTDMSAAESAEITSEAVPLTEAAASVPIKIISPGWGSSGYYPAAVLQRDGPNVFKAGMHMYVDHPTPQEEAQRPERSLKGLAAVLESDARWQENGKQGPGLYATAKLFGDHEAAIKERAAHIGVSIRAMGQAKQGEAEGRKGAIIEAITAGRSVDFVTLPGAGGAILSESRGAIQPPVINTEPQEVQNMMTEAEQKELSDVKAENARLREAQQLREAAGLITATLAEAKTLPTITRDRLARQLANSGVFVEGKLDEAATKAAVEATIKDELEYLSKVSPTGRITGMGSGSPAPVDQAKFAESLAKSLQDIGLSETGAKLAANR